MNDCVWAETFQDVLKKAPSNQMAKTIEILSEESEEFAAKGAVGFAKRIPNYSYKI